MTYTIHFQQLRPEAQLPSRATPGSIGLDIYACIISTTGRPNNVMIPAHATRPIYTGIEFTGSDPGVFHMVCSRSGLAAQGIFVTNGPGIIDPDYQGELIILLHNGSHSTYYVRHGDRIAQLITVQGRILVPTFDAKPNEPVRTIRGAKGMGSTGR